MSFSQDAKNDLCTQSIKKRCCKTSLLYGMLLFSGVFTGNRIKLITETEGVANLVAGLLHSLAGVESNLYVSEKKSGGETIGSYKLTVAVKADVEKVSALFDGKIEEIDPSVFTCPMCESSFLRGAFLVGEALAHPKADTILI